MLWSNRPMGYYRIKDAAEKVGVQPHVLRFWESQFPSHKPAKTSRGQRLYSDEDVESFLKIKHLLYDQGFSIPGAKKALKEEKAGGAKPAASADDAVSKEVLREILAELRKFQDFARDF